MSDIGFGYAPAARPPSAARRARHRPRGQAEYRAYYAIVLGAALPVAALAFAADALRGRPSPSPLRRARAQAMAIAPMIFAP
jgi:hypothetical protein